MAITTMITTIVVAALVAGVVRSWLQARVALRSPAAADAIAARPSILDVLLAGLAAVRAQLALRNAPLAAAPVVAYPVSAAPETTFTATVADVAVDGVSDVVAGDDLVSPEPASSVAFERVPLSGRVRAGSSTKS